MVTTEIAPTLHAQRLGDVMYVLDRPNQFAIKPSVCNEVISLIEQGIDIELTDTPDPHRLPMEEQVRVDREIAQLESAPNGAELFRQPPAMSRWAPLTKRAIALHPLYEAATAETLGEGIPAEVFDRPLFRTVTPGNTGDNVLPAIRRASATDILRDEKPRIADKIIGHYKDFVGQSIDAESRRFYRGSKDGQAIRTRAYEATRMAIEHFTDGSGAIHRSDLRSASLACGAAGPVSSLVKEMEAQGAKFEKVTLVDQDPMALASAKALTERAGLSDEVVDIQLRNLLGGELTDYIEPNSVDIADLLGLVEYLPTQYAVALLSRVKAIMRPGGVILWGNMLNDRPQQRMFKEVAKWPPLKQRTITECLDIIQEAGFDLADVRVRIPAGEGVYALYEMSIRESNTGLQAPAVPLRAAA